MANDDRDQDRGQERGMQRRGGVQVEPYEGGQMRRYGDQDWHRGHDAYGNPVWYRSYGWSWTSGGPQQEQEPHRHGRTQGQNYQRSDERIREDVCDRLNDHPGIDSSTIAVTVSNGEVTLEGTVDDRREKRLAEDTAEAVSGVKDVQNRLRLAQSQQQGQMQGQQPGRQNQHPRVREGMQVVGSNGDPVGNVMQVRDDTFRVDRGAKGDVYLAFENVQDTSNDRVTLDIPAGRVDDVAQAATPQGDAQTTGTKGR